MRAYLSGRALRCQRKSRGFESHRSLQIYTGDTPIGGL